MFGFVFKWRTAIVLWLTPWCCFSPNPTNEQEIVSTYAVGTPTSATVCDGDTVTLTCDISQAGGAYAVWLVFNTSNTSSSPLAFINMEENIPPYNYPKVQPEDTVSRLEVMASSSIDGYHFQCKVDYRPPIYSPGAGSITVKGIPSCPTGVNLDDSTLGNNGCDVSLTWQQPSKPPPVIFTTVTYCPTSSPNCGNSVNCTSPCTIRGLLNDTEYQFTVSPSNNCGSPTGCTGNKVTHHRVSCQGTVREIPTSDTITLSSTTTFLGTSAGGIRGVQHPIILVLFCLVALFLRFW